MVPIAVRHPLLGEITNHLSHHGTTEAGLHAVLDRVLDSFACVAGTIHDVDPHTGVLRLRAQRRIPEVVQERVRMVPIGKGMAGLAAERRQPVQVCNLQTDTSGCAKPSALETKMAGCIAVPMLAGDAVHGVLGIAKPEAYDFNAEETALLLQAGGVVAEFLAR
jgi:transcriptional regulator with GAF, ATPase, and Fis domain